MTDGSRPAFINDRAANEFGSFEKSLFTCLFMIILRARLRMRLLFLSLSARIIMGESNEGCILTMPEIALSHSLRLAWLIWVPTWVCEESRWGKLSLFTLDGKNASNDAARLR